MHEVYTSSFQACIAICLVNTTENAQWVHVLRHVWPFADPNRLYPPGFSVHRTSPPRLLEWLQFPPLGDLPDTGMKFTFPTSPALQVDSLPLSHLGIQKYTMFHLINLSCQNFQELAQWQNKSFIIALLALLIIHHQLHCV